MLYRLRNSDKENLSMAFCLHKECSFLAYDMTNSSHFLLRNPQPLLLVYISCGEDDLMVKIGPIGTLSLLKFRKLKHVPFLGFGINKF